MKRNLFSRPEIIISRQGGYVLAELLCPHLVLSTSSINGGIQKNLNYLINHQSCEGAGQAERYAYITSQGPQAYHEEICQNLGIKAETSALMGTAANMDYLALKSLQFGSLEVLAAVTAGVQSNATCAGDPAKWTEQAGLWKEVEKVKGTINTLLWFNQPLTEAALTRALMTATEGKSAALLRLGIGSTQSEEPATGTGTDQVILASVYNSRNGQNNEQSALTWSGTHTKLGELIGQCVIEASLEALRWQNGLEISYTRGVLHILKRFGITREKWLSLIQNQCSVSEWNLLKNNEQAFIYDPSVAANAWAFSSILDRQRYGALPKEAVERQLHYQCALLATALSGQPDSFTSHYNALGETLTPWENFAKAVILGLATKWK